MTFPPPPAPGDQPRFPPVYPADAWDVVPVRGTNGLSIASMVLGIVGLIVCCLCIPSILAIVFGAVSLKEIKRSGQAGRGMAIAGLVTGIVGIAFFVLVFAIGSVDFSFEP